MAIHHTRDGCHHNQCVMDRRKLQCWLERFTDIMNEPDHDECYTPFDTDVYIKYMMGVGCAVVYVYKYFWLLYTQLIAACFINI